MKKAFLFLSYIVLCSISIIARASENLPNEFSVSPNAVSLSSASSTYNYIYVDAPGNWSITSAPSWFTSYISSGSGSQYIYYSVPTNFGQDRSGIVTFYDSFNAKSYDLAVNQQGYNSSIYYFTPSLNFGATNPTSNTVNMYTTYDQWALSSAPSWISLTSNIITGNGSGYLSFNAIAEVNRGPNRSGVLVVKNLSNQVTKSIFVTQSSTVNGFAVSPSAIIFQSASYTTSNLIEVTAADSWSASYPSWLSLSPPAGTGNQKVSLSPDYNNGLNRFGTITFFDSYSNKSKIVTITQPGTVSFSVTPSNANFGATSPLSTQVNILGYQNWNITSKPSWITTTSSSGYGSASFQLIAQPNNGNPRSGTVSIFDNFTSRTQNITVNQASSLNPFSVTPSAPSYSSASGTTVQISVVSAGQWSVSNLPAWVYTNISSGIGNATVYAYANYNSGGPRSGIITFHDDYSSSNAFVTITQPGSNYFSVTPSSISFSAASPTNSTVNIYSNYGWSITSKPSWITPSYSSGYGNSSIQLYAQPNTGNVRSGTVTVYDTYNGNTQYISVNQASSIYGFSVTPSAPNYSSASGTSVQISVVSPGQWSATNYPSWISVNPSSGIGNTSVNAYAGYNSGLKRFGTITFYDNSTSSYAYVTITQPGYSTFNISPTSLQFGKGAVSKQLQITANGSWYVSSTPSWLSSDVSSGYGNTVINLLTSSNSGAVRYGTLVFYDYNSSSYVNVNVSQDGVSSVFTVSPSNISFSSASPTSTSVNIVATGTWNITSIPNWIYTSTSSGKGQQSINIYAYSTSSSQPRKGTISIYDASNQSTNYLCVSQSNNSPIGTLTITALNQIREYGNPNNFNYTISGFKNGDNSSIVSGTPLFSSPATSQSPAGYSYPISINGCELSVSNYNLTNKNGTLTVNPAILTVYSDQLELPIGMPIPKLTYYFRGFKNGENQSIISGAPILSTTATNFSPVGDYPIYIFTNDLNAPNYKFVANTTDVLKIVLITDYSTNEDGLKINASPNPTNGNYGITFDLPNSISSEDVILQMVDGKGQEIKNINIQNSPNSIYMSVEGLESGIYLANLYLNNQNRLKAKSFKIIVNR